MEYFIISYYLSCSFLQTICDLPNILGKEEEDSYKEVSSTNCDALSALHNDMCKLVTLNIYIFFYDKFRASEVK